MPQFIREIANSRFPRKTQFQIVDHTLKYRIFSQTVYFTIDPENGSILKWTVLSQSGGQTGRSKGKKDDPKVRFGQLGYLGGQPRNKGGQP